MNSRSDLQDHIKSSVKNYLEAVRPIVDELFSEGIKINQISDLRYSTREVYLKALPILIAWLDKDLYEALKEDIVRTLSMPWAKPDASKALIKEFKRIGEENSLNWAIGNGISITAMESDVDDLLGIIANKKFGTSRQMIVQYLFKLKDPRIEINLIPLLDDEDVQGHAIYALGRLKSKLALEKIKQFLNDSRTWIRNAAKKSVQQIERN